MMIFLKQKRKNNIPYIDTFDWNFKVSVTVCTLNSRTLSDIFEHFNSLQYMNVFYKLSMSIVHALPVMCLNQRTNWQTVQILGPVIQSIFSLTSPFVDKMLTVLVSTTSKLHVFLLKKM